MEMFMMNFISDYNWENKQININNKKSSVRGFRAVITYTKSPRQGLKLHPCFRLNYSHLLRNR